MTDFKSPNPNNIMSLLNRYSPGKDNKVGKIGKDEKCNYCFHHPFWRLQKWGDNQLTRAECKTPEHTLAGAMDAYSVLEVNLQQIHTYATCRIQAIAYPKLYIDTAATVI